MQELGLKAFLGRLPGFAVFPLVGSIACPLTGLCVDVGEIRKGAQRPEALANVADGPLHFAFTEGIQLRPMLTVRRDVSG